VADTITEVQHGFAAYDIERELGSGGMATVYLAHDRKHDRRVAIKVLHPELAAMLGTDRFVQEIRVTANLQHPHILGLIDSGVISDDGGELRGRPYYVMPYIDGETLRDRLDKEQQLPISDAIRIASEVASALDYAHRHGVIHRDIKPENILLHDGSAIVADFGIALAVTQAGGSRMTQTGLSLGTPFYMSPEQAMGERTITARSDIYSVGAVAYEMLCGEPPFTGPNTQAVVSRVITEEPRELTNQRRSIPSNVSQAVSHALEKIPADRFASAREFAEALSNPSYRSAASAGKTRMSSAGASRDLLYALAAAVVIFAGLAIWGWVRPSPKKQVIRYAMAMDPAELLVPGGEFWSRIALSPDGTKIAYLSGPRRQLMMRSRNDLRARRIVRGEVAYTPFFSPDGTRVGFMSNRRELSIESMVGGTPLTIADTLMGPTGATWAPDDFIYTDGYGPAPLVRVEAKSGAVPRHFTTLDKSRGETDHIWPDALPSGKGIIFTVVSGSATGATRSIAVAEVPSGKHRVLIEAGLYARYSPSGHLVYVTPDKTLMMVPFDQGSLKITGDPVAIVQDARPGLSGSADIAISKSGTLMYATGGSEGKQELVWVTRDGKAESVDPDWQGSFTYPSLSPDGSRVAITTGVAENSVIWVKQLDHGPTVRLTLEGSSNYYPAWSPDGRSVAFSSNDTELYTKRADGSSQAALQIRDPRRVLGPRWSPDGKWLVYRTDRQTAGAGDIVGIRPGVDSTPAPLVATKASELSPAISPNGKWMAYASNETGSYEIYVVPFPNTRDAKWAISTQGGSEPVWSHDGNELFYRDAASNLISMQVTNSPTFATGRSTVLFASGNYAAYEASPQYDVSPDGKRFLMMRAGTGTLTDRVIVVENWFEELKTKGR